MLHNLPDWMQRRSGFRNTYMSDRRVAMKVALVSQDHELYEVCRTTLRQLSIDGPILEAVGSKHGKADLTIWDISPGVSLPERKDAETLSQDLFVVSKASLGDVQKVVGAGGFGFLLKPVKQPALAAFLSSAVNRWSGSADKNSHGGKSLRADRDELLQILLEANLRLQQCDQDRTNFLARALHDFRTPLTALQGYCGMLIRQSAGPLDPGQIELLERMQHSISRLAKMSGAMFELTSRHNTERRLNLLRSSIDDCVQHATDQIAPMAQEKGITVNVDLHPPDTLLYMDPAAIEQVLVNLLENSCKFTRRNGSIEITGRLASWESMGPQGNSGSKEMFPAYKIEVRDNGMGILPEQLDSVFEEYTRYAGARDRSGGGLGLAICKMLIAEHQGAIWAQSDRQGTKMSFVLPLHHEMVIGQPVSVSDGAVAVSGY
jgi:signal transduction histidine kinase